MTKRQLVDEIVAINRTAKPAFLARFDDEDLEDYLSHLRTAQGPRLTGDSGRYEQYFQGEWGRPYSPVELDKPRWRDEPSIQQPLAITREEPSSTVDGVSVEDHETLIRPDAVTATPAPLAPADSRETSADDEDHAETDDQVEVTADDPHIHRQPSEDHEQAESVKFAPAAKAASDDAEVQAVSAQTQEDPESWLF